MLPGGLSRARAERTHPCRRSIFSFGANDEGVVGAWGKVDRATGDRAVPPPPACRNQRRLCRGVRLICRRCDSEVKINLGRRFAGIVPGRVKELNRLSAGKGNGDRLITATRRKPGNSQLAQRKLVPPAAKAF